MEKETQDWWSRQSKLVKFLIIITVFGAIAVLLERSRIGRYVLTTLLIPLVILVGLCTMAIIAIYHFFWDYPFLAIIPPLVFACIYMFMAKPTRFPRRGVPTATTNGHASREAQMPKIIARRKKDGLRKG